MRQSNFNFKRITNSNKIDKKESAKMNKFEQSVFRNNVLNFLICVANIVVLNNLRRRFNFRAFE